MIDKPGTLRGTAPRRAVVNEAVVVVTIAGECKKFGMRLKGSMAKTLKDLKNILLVIVTSLVNPQG